MRRRSQPSGAVARRGVTLIELLIVISILVMVTAASIPLMLSGVEQRRMREGARLVSSYISSVRSRAIETGRSAGVMFQQAPASTAAAPFCMTLVTVEVPPPYSGDAVNSVAQATASGLTSLGTDTGWSGLVRVGDLIRFNYQGRTFVILGPSGATPGQYLQQAQAPSSSAPWLLAATDQSGVPPNTPQPVPYQIIRQPVKSAVAPLQLPEGAVIDLKNSGVGVANNSNFGLSTPYANPILTFSPTGAVEFVYDGPPQGQGLGITRPSSAMFLLIGRRDGMSDVNQNQNANTANPQNLFDLSSLWVSVGPTTGLVVTSENALAANTPTNSPRYFAQQAQSMGGR